MGYHGTHTPPVVQRNVLENPGWYTAYTPYQAEIAQGRLEALLNFQTMICELTAMEIANASLLDEGTAAAEAMAMAHAVSKTKSAVLAVATDLSPADPRRGGDAGGTDRHRRWSMSRRAHLAAIEAARPFAVVLQYPGANGDIRELSRGDQRSRTRRCALVVAADPCAGAADAAGRDGCGRRRRLDRSASACRWASAARTRAISRRATTTSASMPGRLVGVSLDADGHPAMRLALQTREQHIRREKATSNICTSQVLLAVIAGCMRCGTGRRD